MTYLDVVVGEVAVIGAVLEEDAVVEVPAEKVSENNFMEMVKGVMGVAKNHLVEAIINHRSS